MDDDVDFGCERVGFRTIDVIGNYDKGTPMYDSKWLIHPPERGVRSYDA